MSFTKTYFLCPTSDFIHPPPEGPVRLGAVLRSTSTPQFPLYAAHEVPISSTYPPVVETDWKRTISTETGLGLGVYAQFLQLATKGFSIGPELDVETSSQAANTFAFDTVTTTSFEPTSQYIDEVVKAPAVQAYLREPRQRFAPSVSLFLVTGLKLVKGARIQYSVSDSTAVSGNVGINVVPLGVTVGPKGHWTRKNEDAVEFTRDSDFVFAFRVKRLVVGRKLKIEEYSKGAFLATGNDGNDDGMGSVLVDDLDGSDMENARLVPDVGEEGNVYCIPA